MQNENYGRCWNTIHLYIRILSICYSLYIIILTTYSQIEIKNRTLRYSNIVGNIVYNSFFRI